MGKAGSTIKLNNMTPFGSLSTNMKRNKKYIKNIIVAIALLFTAMSIFFIVRYSLQEYEVISLDVDEFHLSEQSEYNHVCVSSQFEIVDFYIRQFSKEMNCLNHNEIPTNKIYVIFFEKKNTLKTHDLQCKIFSLDGDLFSENNSETRCFETKTVNNLKLVRDKQIYSFRSE